MSEEAVRARVSTKAAAMRRVLDESPDELVIERFSTWLAEVVLESEQYREALGKIRTLLSGSQYPNDRRRYGMATPETVVAIVAELDAALLEAKP